MVSTARSTGRGLFGDGNRRSPQAEGAKKHAVDGGEHDGGNGEGQHQFNQREARAGVLGMLESQIHWTGGVLAVICLVISTTVLKWTE